jgi:YidC/Oxa1 family membrane protein insertase
VSPHPVFAGAFDWLGQLYNTLAFLNVPFKWILGELTRFYQGVPVLNGIGAYGLAIVSLTIMVKIVLFPLFQTQLRLTKKSQAEQRKVAPELAELRKKYKKDPQKLNTEMMALYKEHGINPLSPVMGCLPTLAQLPVLIGLYRAIFDHKFFENLHVSPYFLGLRLDIPASTDVAHWQTWILPALAGLTTFVQSKMITPPAAADAEQDPQAAQMAQMTQSMSLLMPLMIVFFSFQKYALQGLVLYWIVSNLFSIFQQYTVNGWGQLPILGKAPEPAPPSGRGGGNGGSGRGSPEARTAKAATAKNAPAGGTRGTKVLVGQTDMNARRGRRR